VPFSGINRSDDAPSPQSRWLANLCPGERSSTLPTNGHKGRHGCRQREERKSVEGRRKQLVRRWPRRRRRQRRRPFLPSVEAIIPFSSTFANFARRAFPERQTEREREWKMGTRFQEKRLLPRSPALLLAWSLSARLSTLLSTRPRNFLDAIPGEVLDSGRRQLK